MIDSGDPARIEQGIKDRVLWEIRMDPDRVREFRKSLRGKKRRDYRDVANTEGEAAAVAFTVRGIMRDQGKPGSKMVGVSSDDGSVIIVGHGEYGIRRA
jgi:hypothetical protein